MSADKMGNPASHEFCDGCPRHPENYPCPFCERIAKGSCAAAPLSDHVVFFQPLNPVTLGHTLFVPNVHVEDASEIPAVTGETFAAAARYARERRQSYNLITSVGHEATQTIRHLHVHYVPRYDGDGLPLPWTEVATDA